MKLILIVAIIVIMLWLITKNKESFYSVKEAVDKSILVNNKMATSGFDPVDDVYKVQYWEPERGYSDMFNYQDMIEFQNKNEVKVDSDKSIFPPKIDGYDKYALALNPYYKQDYVVYEKEYETKVKTRTVNEVTNFLIEKLYDYLLVQITDGKPIIVHRTTPRNKVVIGENVYFAYGNFQLGPLLIKSL